MIRYHFYPIKKLKNCIRITILNKELNSSHRSIRVCQLLFTNSVCAVLWTWSCFVACSYRDVLI